MYNDVRYARSRLNGTIVRNSNGRAVSVTDIGGRDRNPTVEYVELRNGRSGSESLFDMILVPPQLGFANHGNAVYYLSRMPMRDDWRQGLRRRNYRCLYGPPAESISQENLAKCIENVYPTYEFALDYCINQGREMAFHSDFAVIDSGRRLLYKYRTSRDEIIPITNGRPDFSNVPHLQPYFEEVINERSNGS